MAVAAAISAKSLQPLQLLSLPSPKPRSTSFPLQFRSRPNALEEKRLLGFTTAASPGCSRSRLVMGASASTPSDFTANIGEILGDVTIFTATGQPVKFKDLWDQNEGIAVVALLRHFGCICCWELASALKESKPKFESAGVKLIAVGVGSPDKARILAERLPFPMDSLYADPDRKAKVFSRFDALRKAGKNYTMAATPDDRSGVLQQGGMFVFKGKELLYARKDEGTGDHAPLDDVFDVCCKVPVA